MGFLSAVLVVRRLVVVMPARKVGADGLCNERGPKRPEIGTGSDQFLICRPCIGFLGIRLYKIDLWDLGWL